MRRTHARPSVLRAKSVVFARSAATSGGGAHPVPGLGARTPRSMLVHNDAMATSDSELSEESLQASSWSAPWPFLNRLPVLLAEAQGSPTAYRELLRHAHEELKARFLAEEPVEELVHARAALVDIVLREVWRTHSVAEAVDWALVAVGGY